MDNQDCILIVGITGTVGREVLKAALKKNDLRIRVLVRSKARLNLSKELLDRIEIIEGDLSNPEDIQLSLKGVTAAFYVSPHLENEEQVAEQFTQYCNEYSIRLVFVGVHIDGANRIIRWIKRKVFGVVMNHYQSKLRLSEKVRQLARDVVILMPTNFYQNDELIKNSILNDGVFPQPLGFKGINRVDCEDIGVAAVTALTDKKLNAGAYPIVGPETLSGPHCAAVWSTALGRKVDYCEDDELWEFLLKKNLEGKKRVDLLKTYRLIRRFWLPTLSKQVAITERLLGRPPRNYELYVKETLDSHSEQSSG